MLLYLQVLLSCYIPDEPFPGHFPVGPERSVVAEPVQDADSVREEGVQLLSADLCSASWYADPQICLGGWGKQTEVDHQTGEGRKREIEGEFVCFLLIDLKCEIVDIFYQNAYV